MSNDTFPVAAHLTADAYAQHVQNEIDRARQAISALDDYITMLRQSEAAVKAAVRPVAGMPALPVLDDASPESVRHIAALFAPRPRNDSTEKDAA